MKLQTFLVALVLSVTLSIQATQDDYKKTHQILQLILKSESATNEWHALFLPNYNGNLKKVTTHLSERSNKFEEKFTFEIKRKQKTIHIKSTYVKKPQHLNPLNIYDPSDWLPWINFKKKCLKYDTFTTGIHYWFALPIVTFPENINLSQLAIFETTIDLDLIDDKLLEDFWKAIKTEACKHAV